MENITVLIVLLIVTLITIVLVRPGKEKNQKIAEAREAYRVSAALLQYRMSLASLQAFPTDPELKEEALRLGRAYSSLTKDEKGVALFGEVDLMNDINAACAAPGADETGSVQECLQALSVLRSNELIDEAEYKGKRAQILEEL